MNSLAEMTHTENGNPFFPAKRNASPTKRRLQILGGLMIVTLIACIAGIFIDHRLITGAPAWLKPAKFALSVSIYCFTLAWLLGFVKNGPRMVRLMANATVIGITIEMIAIIGQAARGTTSHFNQTTPLNTFIWFTMGAFIMLVWVMNVLLAILLVRQRMPDRAFAWSLRLGVLISAVGMAAAFFMVTPTAAQRTALAGGHSPHIIGAHSVGVADGGPGLPVVGWSTVGGDLRIAHFVGLHGLQVLPFLGWLLTRRKGWLNFFSNDDRLQLVWTAGLAYLGLVLLLAWQALRGQSVIHPDSKTLGALGLLVVGVVISVSIRFTRVLRRNRHAQELATAIQILSQ